MQRILEIVMYLGLLVFIAGLSGQYHARNKGKIRLNSRYATMSMVALVVFLGTMILIRILYG